MIRGFSPSPRPGTALPYYKLCAAKSPNIIRFSFLRADAPFAMEIDRGGPRPRSLSRSTLHEPARKENPHADPGHHQRILECHPLWIGDVAHHRERNDHQTGQLQHSGEQIHVSALHSQLGKKHQGTLLNSRRLRRIPPSKPQSQSTFATILDSLFSVAWQLLADQYPLEHRSLDVSGAAATKAPFNLSGVLPGHTGERNRWIVVPGSLSLSRG